MKAQITNYFFGFQSKIFCLFWIAREKSLKNTVIEHVIKIKHFFHCITCVKEHE